MMGKVGGCTGTWNRLSCIVVKLVTVKKIYQNETLIVALLINFLRYESTIVGQFYGHTHFDHFEVFYDVATLKRPTSVAYISPSVTPYTNINMGYRIFTLDGNYTDSSWVLQLFR